MESILRHIKHLSLLIVIVSAGCVREDIFVLDPDLLTNGYEVRGRVYDPIGTPIPDVDIYLDFDIQLLDNGDPPTKVYQVNSTGEVITVNVVRRDGSFFRNLATVSAGGGPFSYDWDAEDASGQLAPPGLYFVRYQNGSTVRHEYPVVVSGSKVTQTNPDGEFLIGNASLPLEYYPVPLYWGGGQGYYGNGRVTSRIFLTFETQFTSRSLTLDLIRDQIAMIDITLE